MQQTEHTRSTGVRRRVTVITVSCCTTVITVARYQIIIIIIIIIIAIIIISAFDRTAVRLCPMHACVRIIIQLIINRTIYDKM